MRASPAIGLIAATLLTCGCGSSAQAPQAPQKTRVSHSDGKATNLSLGQTGSDDGLRFTVSQITRQSGYQDAAAGQITPHEGATILITHVKVANDTGGPSGVLCDLLRGNSIAIVDSDARAYTPMIASYELEANQDPNADRCVQPLSAGLGDDLTLLFEVPSAAQPAGVIVWNGDGDGTPDDGGSYLVFRP